MNTLWFILVGILLGGYAILDGFDLGVGALHLLAKGDYERRCFLNSIGPVWDGNEVWLVTGGGALFAAFPNVYATIFSGFYLGMILLLFGLIFRAVSIEFRSKLESPVWRGTWDVAFSLSSILSSLLIGIVVGNVAWGIPVDANGNYTGTFLDLLNPYALLIGIMTLVTFMMHGSIYLVMKTEGRLQATICKWTKPLIWTFIVLFILVSVVTLASLPEIKNILTHRPWAIALLALIIFIALNIPREHHHRRFGLAFISSSVTMLMMFGLFAISLYPNMVFTVNDSHNLTIYNSSSTNHTLWIMTIVAIIAVPLVLSYSFFIYYIFRGKVEITKESY